MAYSIRKRKKTDHALKQLNTVKSSTREELLKRLSIGKDYLNSSIQTQTTIEEVCREIGMSKYHFIRTFKMLYGITPRRHLKHQRMNFAKELLKNTSLEISDIAAKSGYESPSAFSRVFRELTGMSSIEFRK